MQKRSRRSWLLLIDHWGSGVAMPGSGQDEARTRNSPRPWVITGGAVGIDDDGRR
jgi:hypothetical protein